MPRKKTKRKLTLWIGHPAGQRHRIVDLRLDGVVFGQEHRVEIGPVHVVGSQLLRGFILVVVVVVVLFGRRSASPFLR